MCPSSLLHLQVGSCWKVPTAAVMAALPNGMLFGCRQGSEWVWEQDTFRCEIVLVLIINTGGCVHLAVLHGTL